MGMIDEFFLNQYVKKPNKIRVFQEFFQVSICELSVEAM